jgi:hypothetical protein
MLLGSTSAVVAAGQNGQTQPPPPQQPMPLSADRGFGTPAAVLANAPIFLLPDATRLPLRIAQAGSQVRVIQQSGEWSNVQFQDPQYGLRTGYMQSRFLTVQPPSNAAAASDAPAAQQPPAHAGATERSETSGFFLGGGFELANVHPNDEVLGSESQTGPGAAVVAGYGFSPIWSLYAEFGTASLGGDSPIDSYSILHFDVGTRIHFAAPSRRTIPFLQAAFTRRAVSQDFTTASVAHTLDASGSGASFGGGVNVHMTRALGISAAASWTVGDLGSYEVDNREVTVTSNSLTSTRFHIGLVWFPRGS